MIKRLKLWWLNFLLADAEISFDYHDARRSESRRGVQVAYRRIVQVKRKIEEVQNA